MNTGYSERTHGLQGAPARLAGLVLAGLIVWLALLALPVAAQAQASGRWAPLGPQRGTVLALAHQPGQPGAVLAGTYFGGLYRSANWGYTWQVVDTPFASGSVFALHFDRRVAGRVYAGLFEQGVWRSDDAGLTWRAATTQPANGSVQALAVDPTNSSRVFAATAGGLALSVDAGQTFAPVAAMAGQPTRDLAFDPLDPARLYVATAGNGVFLSEDAGATWRNIDGALPLGVVNALAFDSAGALQAATAAGVFRRAPGASAWSDMSSGLPVDQPVLHVRAHPARAGLVLAATPVGLYVADLGVQPLRWYRWTVEGTRQVAIDDQGLIIHALGQIASLKASTDFGGTWAQADTGLQTAFIGAVGAGLVNGQWLLVAGTDLGAATLDFARGWQTPLPLTEGLFDVHLRDGTVYLGAETSGVYRSVDAGQTWTAASRGIVPTQVRSLSYTAEDSPTLLAATGSGAYRSPDDGATWQAVRLPQISYVHSVAADPKRPPIVWLATGGGQVYRSLDRGENWSFAGNGLPNEDIVSLVHAPWTGVYALTAAGALWSTTDDGRGWFPSVANCGAPIRALRVDPARPWVLYAATLGAGLCKSESGGIAWQAINQGVSARHFTALWIDAANPQRLWAGGVGEVLRSTDGGATWTAGGTLPNAPVIELQGDPAQPQRLVALLSGQGLYESLDAGATWRALNGQNAAAGALTLAAHPAQAGHWLVGTPHLGVQRSTDGGASFAARNDGMSLFVRSIASDPADGQRLYAGTLGGGVFRTDDAAASWRNIGLAAGNVFRVRSPAADRLMVGTGNGIADSLDGGNTWYNLGQRASFVQSLLADPADPRHVLVGGQAGQVYESDSSDVRWRSVGHGLPARDLLAMTTCADGSIYAAPERAGVWRASWAAPASWVDAGSAGLTDVQVVALACDPRSGLLYAATNARGVYLSLDRGAGWAAVNQGLPASAVISAVLPHPTRAFEVWTAVRDGTVYRSVNAGLAWTAAGEGLPAGGVSALVGEPGGALLAATASGVFRRTSGAAAWQAAGTGLPAGTIRTLWADPSRSGMVFAAVVGAGLHRSTDGGVSFTAAGLAAGSADVVALAGAGVGENGRVHAGTAGTGLTWSVDGGASFGPVQAAASVPLVVLDLAVDPQDPQTIYAATGGQGVLVSRNGGGHWLASPASLGSDRVICLAVHPQRPREVYAGTNGGVFVSTDAGATWQAFSTGLVNRNVTALTFDTLLPDMLYVGLEGGGVWFTSTAR